MSPPDQQQDGAAEGEDDDRAKAKALSDADRRFIEAMRRFDQRLAREQFDGDETNTGKDQSSVEDGAGAAEDGENLPRAASRLAGIEAAAGESEPGDEDDEGSTARGGIGNRSGYAPPPGTPDGRDDDIVARQLREAAESEPDPELRERLWEEYRAYKNDEG